MHLIIFYLFIIHSFKCFYNYMNHNTKTSQEVIASLKNKQHSTFSFFFSNKINYLYFLLQL